MAKALQYPGYFAHRFVPIHRSNYTAGRGGNKPQFVIVHLMAGTYAGSISWAQNAQSNVSWHYAVARNGHTTQNLSEGNTAWTNSNWYINQRGVSLEHGGTLAHGGPTDAQLHASAKITAGICYRHDIPINRKRIFGHNEIQGVQKACPGPWPWERYIALVKAYRFPKDDGGGGKPGTVHRVICGSFSSREYAEARARALQGKGFSTYLYRHEGSYRVQVGSFSERGGAEAFVAQLRRAGFESFVVAD